MAELQSEFKVLLLQAPINLKNEDLKTFGFFPPLGTNNIFYINLAEGKSSLMDAYFMVIC